MSKQKNRKKTNKNSKCDRNLDENSLNNHSNSESISNSDSNPNSDSDSEDTVVDNGYCHYNSNNSGTIFTIDVCGIDLDIIQNPGGHKELGHGAVVWDSGVILTKYLEHNSNQYNYATLCNKVVLELGAACGLVGLFFMMKGAKVILTDLEAVVNGITIPNCNGVYSKLKPILGTYCCANNKRPASGMHKPFVTPLDWTKDPGIQINSRAIWEHFQTTPYPDMQNEIIIPDTISLSHGDAVLTPGLVDINLDSLLLNSNSSEALSHALSFDYILLTDCVFSAHILDSLITVLKYCSYGHTTILCCYEIRDLSVIELFLSKMKQCFKVKLIPISKLHPSYKTNAIEIIQCKLIRERKVK